MTHMIETDTQLEEFLGDAGQPYYFVQCSGQPWIVFCNEDGDWYATRPANDDDRRDDGTFPPGVTVDFESLGLPMLVIPGGAQYVIPDGAL